MLMNEFLINRYENVSNDCKLSKLSYISEQRENNEMILSTFVFLAGKGKFIIYFLLNMPDLYLRLHIRNQSGRQLFEILNGILRFDF